VTTIAIAGRTGPGILPPYYLTMPRPQKLFGAKSAKAYAGAGGLMQYFTVKPKPPPPGRDRGRPSKKRKTQHALGDGSAHNAPVNMFEGEEQQAPPPAANVSFQIKKTHINWGKGKHHDLLGRAIQDWRKRIAGNINNIKGCCECYCRKLLINVPYIRTFGVPDQGQTLDVRESQTAKSALRDDWTRNIPHHTLEVVLEVTLEHMCTGLRP
jgi:hypothetical protein